MSKEMDNCIPKIITDLQFQMASVEENLWYIECDIERIKNEGYLPMDRSLDFHLGMQMGYLKVIEDIRRHLSDLQRDDY